MSEEGEVVVGIHESGMKLVEGQHLGKTFYCSRCKSNIHCYVKIEDKKAEIIMTCSNDVCKCKCKTHYPCKLCGYLHWYGKMCDREEEEIIPNKKSDEAFDKIMDEWREDNKEVENKVVKKGEKNEKN